jgi:hypothetical protein
MGFRKIRTIQVSERVFDFVCDALDTEASEYDVKISGYLECFNNCREQGYVLHVSSVDWDNPNQTKEDLCIWAFEARSSDEIVVSWQNEYPHNGMFSEDTYNNRRKYFHYNELQKAADFIIDLVKEHFKAEFNYKK